MKSYAATLSKHRRLAILEFLSKSPQGTSNGELLLDICNGTGGSTTRDQLVGDLNWLRDQAMVDIDDHSGFLVVTIRAHGADIAKGAALHDGVQPPSFN